MAIQAEKNIPVMLEALERLSEREASGISLSPQEKYLKEDMNRKVNQNRPVLLP